MTKKLFLVLERTPLFFLDEEMQNLTDAELEVSKEFYESYQQIENDFRVLQESLFHMYLESQLAQQEASGEPVVTDEEVDDNVSFMHPVHDPNTIH